MISSIVKRAVSIGVFMLVAAILSATSQGQGHFMRKGSIVEFLNDLGFKNVEKHTQSASFLAKFLFDRVVQINYVLNVDNALITFFQGPLPELNDIKNSTGQSVCLNIFRCIIMMFAGFR